jgi:hypothetical protein
MWHDLAAEATLVIAERSSRAYRCSPPVAKILHCGLWHTPEAIGGANESVGILRNFGRAGELASMALRDWSGHGRLLTVEVTTRARLRSPAAAWQVRRAR